MSRITATTLRGRWQGTAKTDPSAPQALRTFGIGAKPLASVGALAQFSKARSRVLSAPELGAFLKRIEALEEGAKKDALRLCILTGGQRPVQLLRARPADVDVSGSAITLRDSKGARREPRLHVVPLVKEARMILERRLEALKEGEPLFSIDHRSAVRIETVSVLVSEIAKKMIEEKEAREPFQLRDLRRTALPPPPCVGASSGFGPFAPGGGFPEAGPESALPRAHLLPRRGHARSPQGELTESDLPRGSLP